MVPVPRFPRRGPRGRSFPRFTGTIEALRHPAAHPAALRCLRLAIPREPSASFVSPDAADCRASGLGSWSPGTPRRDFFRGDDRASQVPGEPPYPFAHDLRPRPAEASLTKSRTLAWPPLRERRRRRREKDFRGSITWLPGSLSTYHGAVTRWPRKTRFQVLVRLSWTGLVPAGLR